MVVDEIRLTDGDPGEVVRSARLRSEKFELRLSTSVPAGFEGEGDDASPFLPPALLLAMRVHEDLRLEGGVSRRLLKAVETIREIYAGWDVGLRPAEVTADPLEDRARGTGRACFFSRGVDSMYAAARRVADDDGLTHLVYCRTLEPMHDDQVRREELRLAEEAASLIGRPLVSIGSDVRERTGPLIGWGDLSGAALAMLGLSLSGGLCRIVIPSTVDARGLAAWGSHPLLDPLFSTGAVEIEHDGIGRSRLAKVGWLVENRPDLLPHLKVCFRANRSDNCGRCQKCLLAMACLRVHGALEQATAFPDEFDPAGMKSRLLSTQMRCWWNDVYWGLAEDDPLRGAIRAQLRRSARPSPGQRLRAWRARLLRRPVPLPPPWSSTNEQFVRHGVNSRIAWLARGRPYP